ncbi:pro-sigmaK processing inhibitor BofA family protein [Peribacillus sp. SCS-155]|uniref:pro-sigmaK processing inhibitor BofA family protein n=1 Tax=Peribacillus sedimenti TaxID=3115297 RepID=UPI003905E71E
MPYIFVGIIGALILLLLVTGTSIKPVRIIGQGLIKLVIGAVFLFFLNELGNKAGIHVPINIMTAAVSGFLGIPGVVALAAIDYWVV